MLTILLLYFSLADQLLGIYEDIRDNSTNETSVFAEKGGIGFIIFITVFSMHLVKMCITDELEDTILPMIIRCNMVTPWLQYESRCVNQPATSLRRTSKWS